MTCDDSNTISAEEISRTSNHFDTIDTVVESPLDTTTTYSGASIYTLRGQLKRLGFLVPVPYAGGISFTINDSAKTVSEGGFIYAPLPELLPFTTSGTWGGDDDARFYPVQGITTLDFPIPVDSIQNLLNVDTSGTNDGATISVASYYGGWAATVAGPQGGGEFVWDAGLAKTSHNGGDIISPTVPWSTPVNDFLNGTGETDPAGLGCWRRLWSGEFNALWGGVRLDGLTDNTGANQFVLNTYPLSFCPPGDNLTNAITIPDQVQEMNWRCAFLANGPTQILVQHANTSRAVQRRIGGFKVIANGYVSVTGFKTGFVTNVPSPGASESPLYTRYYDISVFDCDIGIRPFMLLESSMENCTALDCVTGWLLDSDVVNGGGNAVSFKDCRAQSNEVGMLISNPTALGRSGCIFDNFVFQENSLCGLAMQSISGSGITAYNFRGCHFELNGLGVPSGGLYHGMSVLRSSVHLNGDVDIALESIDMNDSIDTMFIVKGGATLQLFDIKNGGNSLGKFADTDSGSRCFLTGPFGGKGYTICNSLNDLSKKTDALFNSPGVRNIRPVRNDSLMDNPVTFDVSNVLSVADSGLTTDEWGIVSYVQFNPVIGDTGNNRLAISGPTGAINDFVMQGLYVKSNIQTNIRFLYVDVGNLRSHIVTLFPGQWVRMTIVAELSATNGIATFIYPEDTLGATLAFSGEQIIRDTSLNIVNDYFKHNVVGYRNDRHQASTASPNFGEWKQGDFVYNSAPTVDGNGRILEGWEKGADGSAVTTPSIFQPFWGSSATWV